MKIINSIWFTDIEGTTVGIVIGEDEHTGKYKAYIGKGSGFNERADAEHIVAQGSRFHLRTALDIAFQLGVKGEQP